MSTRQKIMIIIVWFLTFFLPILAEPQTRLQDLSIVQITLKDAKMISPVGFYPQWSPDGKKILFTVWNDKKVKTKSGL